MKSIRKASLYCLFVWMAICGGNAEAQDSARIAAVTAALSRFQTGDYLTAARMMSRYMGDAGLPDDWLLAARAYAAAGATDSAFVYLNALGRCCFTHLADLNTSSEFGPLQTDPRWDLVTMAMRSAALKQNKGRAVAEVIFSRRVFGRSIVADEIGNVYLTRNDNTLTRFNAAGDSTGFYRGVINGDIGFVDVTNPLRILLYYPEQQRVVVLGRMMDVLADIDLRRTGIVQRSAIAMSADGSIWVWDARNGSLVKINTNLEKVGESNDLRQQIGFLPQPVMMQEKDRRLYMLDEGGNFLTFDQFGSFVSASRLDDARDFAVVTDRVVYAKLDAIFSVDLQSGRSERRIVPQISGVAIRNVALSRNVLYVLYDDRLIWFTVPG